MSPVDISVGVYLSPCRYTRAAPYADPNCLRREEYGSGGDGRLPTMPSYILVRLPDRSYRSNHGRAYLFATPRACSCRYPGRNRPQGHDGPPTTELPPDIPYSIASSLIC